MLISLSVNHLFTQALKNECKVRVRCIHSEEISEENVADRLKGLDGVLVAPGFGSRGIDGKIIAIRHVRENNISHFLEYAWVCNVR